MTTSITIRTEYQLPLHITISISTQKANLQNCSRVILLMNKFKILVFVPPSNNNFPEWTMNICNYHSVTLFVFKLFVKIYWFRWQNVENFGYCITHSFDRIMENKYELIFEISTLFCGALSVCSSFVCSMEYLKRSLP